MQTNYPSQAFKMTKILFGFFVAGLSIGSFLNPVHAETKASYLNLDENQTEKKVKIEETLPENRWGLSLQFDQRNYSSIETTPVVATLRVTLHKPCDKTAFFGQVFNGLHSNTTEISVSKESDNIPHSINSLTLFGLGGGVRYDEKNYFLEGSAGLIWNSEGANGIDGSELSFIAGYKLPLTSNIILEPSIGGRLVYLNRGRVEGTAVSMRNAKLDFGYILGLSTEWLF